MSLIAGLNWLDLLILVVFIVGMGMGYMQGFIRQVMGLAALYIGTILGAQYHLIVAGWLMQFFPSAPVRFVNAFGFVLILFLVTSIINWLASDAYGSGRVHMLPTFDHLAGSLLGLGTAFVVIALLLPVVRFAVGETWPWAWAESGRSTLLTGLNTSHLIYFFDQAKPELLAILTPWLPNGLPSIFNL